MGVGINHRDYERPNKGNVAIGDYILELDNKDAYNVQIIPINEVTELSAKTFQKDSSGKDICSTFPYINSIIKKSDGKILVGQKVSGCYLERILELTEKIIK
jgi:hypothetical protein